MASWCTLIGVVCLAMLSIANRDDAGCVWATESPAGISTLSEADLQRLAKAKIYFGHMSVGRNIIEGVKELQRDYPKLKLNITEIDGSDPLEGAVFAHGPIGENHRPMAKIDDFSKKIRNGLGNTANIAFFKFCYIDMMADQQVEGVFARYKSTMEALSKAYPETEFVHVTIPLTVVQTGPKAVVKRIFGIAPGWYLDNVRRNEYNEKLHKTYDGKEPLFDLAGIESTYPDGRRATFDWRNRTYYKLAPEYGRDGRHLNEDGRKWVAEHLILFLAGTLRNRSLNSTAAKY